MTDTKQWNILLADQRSRRKLSAGSNMRGIENKKWECYAASKTRAKNLLEDGATALDLSKSWTEESPHKKELALLLESDSLHLPGQWYEERSGREERTIGRSCKRVTSSRKMLL